MKLDKKTQIKDIKKIMSVEEEMIRLLFIIEDDKNTINPWVTGLSRIFDQLDIKKKGCYFGYSLRQGRGFCSFG